MSQNFVISGANRGIGYAVARELVREASSPARRVVLLCRDRAAGARARDELSALGPAQVVLVVGALDSVRTITQAAHSLLAVCPTIEVLIHNAGLWPARLVRNEDGLEQAFVVNHLAPFLLNRLLEQTLAESRARVVQVSAGLHVQGKPDLLRTPTGEDFSALSTYATTKMCNLALLPLFAERFRPLGVTVNALHPGVIRTQLGDRDNLLGGVIKLVKRLWQNPEEGARPVVRLALDPVLTGVTGRYYHIDVEREPAPRARAPGLAAALWKQAELLTGLAGRAAATPPQSADGATPTS